MKGWLTLAMGAACALAANAQVLEVVDFSGKGIAGAHVVCMGTGEPTLRITDDQGRCDLPRERPLTIDLSAVGYRTHREELAGQIEPLRIALKRNDVALGEVVVTAQYAPTRREDVVHKVRVISASEIASRGAVNMTDVLRQELNFRVSNDNILGAGLGMNGISGENVKILIDGVPVIGRLDGNIDLNQLNINEIERVEIVEGPLAVNYGTNALAGTINLISKRPQQGRRSAFAEVYTESAGHYNVSGGAEAGQGVHGLRVSGGRNFFDGWHPGDSPFWHRRSGVADQTRFQQWNPREQLFGRASYRISGKDSYLELSGQLFREDIINRGRPDAAYGERAFDDVYRTARSDISAKYQRPLGEDWSMHLIAGFNDFRRIKNTYVTDLTGVNSTLTDIASLNDTSSFRTLMSRGSVIGAPYARLHVQLGYEVEVEYASGARIVDETGRIDNYALFATAEWQPLEQLTLKPGLRLTQNSRYDAPVVPSLNALYKVGERQRYRASYARGFRAPGLKELSFYFVDINHNIIGNPDLNAEHSHHFSFGYEMHPAGKSPWGFSLSGFYNDIEDLITLAQINEVEYSYVNIGHQETAGLQGELRYARGGFDARVGAVYTAISNRLGHREEVPSHVYTPEANANVRYTTPSGKWTASLFYKFNGPRNFFLIGPNESVREATLAGFHMGDLSVERRLWKDQLTVQVGSRNLFNVQNVLGAGSGGAHGGGAMQAVGVGRTYFVRAALQLQNKNRR